MPAEIAHRVLIKLLPALFTALLLGCSLDKGEHDEAETAAVEVQTVSVELRTVEEVIRAIGRTEALPNRLVTLTPAVAGHVHEILTTVGSPVRRGDVIIRLDSIVATADVTEKESQRDTLKAALELLIAPPRPEDRRAPEIAVEQAKVAVTRAEAILARLQPLKARKEISEAEWFDAQQTVVQAKLVQQSAEGQLQLLLVGPRPEAVAEAKARLAAAEQTLAVTRAHLALHELRSPIDGVVDSLNCHPGQAIAVATVVAEVVDPSELYITAWLPARAAEKIKPGQAGTITTGESATPGRPTDEIPETAVHAEAVHPENAESAGADASAANETAEKHESRPPVDHSPMCKVVSVGRIVDPQTGNLPVRLLLENAQGRFAVGQTLSVAIVVAEMEKVLAVPSTAVIDLGEGPLLMVVREGKVAHLHPESPVTHGSWTIISGTDLKPGEAVVIDGGFNVPENTAVKQHADDSAVAEAE